MNANQVYTAIMAKVNRDLSDYLSCKLNDKQFIERWTGTAVTIIRTLGENNANGTRTPNRV